MTQEPDEAMRAAAMAAVLRSEGFPATVLTRSESYHARLAKAEARIKELEEYLAAVVMDVHSRNKEKRSRVLANVYEMTVPIRAKMKGGDA